ncbi:MAG: hypothetical protein H0W08_19585 [Acidobacteria bacterium]|nr:hypothetical protein [Acidobacteriota bacterium]
MGGGFWPKGTANQYVFNSGLQVAGVIGGIRSENPWAGDTASAMFLNFRGNHHGEQVRPIYNSTDPDDVANWPAAAYVPDQPNEADNLFHPALRGRLAASEGDVWWLTWDGNPLLSVDRLHPLGVLVEQRGMAWNTPSGNQDVIYFTHTIYNITSTRAADYVGVRPAMREILLEKAREFQELNNAASGFTLPPEGYPITDMHVAFAADMDIGDFRSDYASVNLPFALGYAYLHDFSQPDDWTFDAEIFAPPFFPGAGIGGIKYLQSPRDSLGREVGVTVLGAFSSDLNQDPASSVQLYRYLTGRPDPAVGDPPCNAGDPKLTHICFINKGPPGDMRFFQATGPLTLPPGGFESVVVAYVFAAPVAAADCAVGCDVTPGDPTILGDAARMAAGVNPIDSITGYRGFADRNGDGRVEQSEFEVVPGSLLGKALVAQAIFDNGFVLSSTAPEAPDFFLIPGPNQVSVLWTPSATETAGDPSFGLVNQPTSSGGTPNLMFDPNYRQFDVEGYRIYRGRVDTPSELRLIAQFDYANTFMVDWRGQVNPGPGCAPELGINTVTVVDGDTTFGCRVPFDSLIPGVAPTVSDTHPLVGPVVQVKLAPEGRQALATGAAIIVRSDTAGTGAASGCLAAAGPNREQCALRDSGVPFAYVDRGVRNDLRYFYTVTAFDVNSLQSGPASLESPRITKAVTPASAASNLETSTTTAVSLVGRGTILDTAVATPGLDSATGRFDGPFPPATGFEFGLVELVQALLPASGSVTVSLDSLQLGSAYENGAGEPGTPAIYFLTASTGSSTSQVQIPVLQDQAAARTSNSTYLEAVSVEEASARRFGGREGFRLHGRLDLELPGNYYTSAWGRGCVNRAAGFAAAGTTGCEYNGARWFDGPSPQRNETKSDPQGAHPPASATPGPTLDLDNAGELTAVATIQMPLAYETAEAGYRAIEGVLGGAQRAADFNLFWGSDGRIDSVVDVTHNVAVPFDSLRLAGSWGVLNQAATAAPGAFDGRPGVLTSMDFTCVEPLRSFAAVQGSYPCPAPAYTLSRLAAPGPIAIWDQAATNATTAAVRPGAGFALYVSGNVTIFELTSGLPAAGTVWSLRTYVGAISGGRGAAGDRGPYTFTPAPRPLTAVGVELRLDYQAVNRVVAATENDLSRVHTVPDPYYVTNAFERTTESKVIQFVNLPADCLIRIYSSSGILVALLEHHSTTFGGSERWNVLNRNDQVVASGIYFYHIEAGDARRVGRFVVVNFAR